MQEESVQPQRNEKSLEEQLAEAQARLGEQREQMLRAIADADNTR
jgi:Fe2+ or Zn2+ uptake regulation protein